VQKRSLTRYDGYNRPSFLGRKLMGKAQRPIPSIRSGVVKEVRIDGEDLFYSNAIRAALTAFGQRGKKLSIVVDHRDGTTSSYALEEVGGVFVLYGIDRSKE